jgi:tRNA dimethylallyltransferase
MNKLLIISGPTATGKTALAVKFAHDFNGEIISADSCQIYKGMDIGTGKDHPKNVKIHLIDLIEPNEKFSVADYQKLAFKKIKEIQDQNKLPILVGCSGFYIDSIVNPKYDTFEIKPNKFLRFILNKFSVKTLQNIYKFLDKKSFSELNNSDKNNPYRLIRRIEIKLSNKKKNYDLQSKTYDLLNISLTAPSQFLYPRIDQRVEERLKMGHLDEIKNLLKKYKWSDYGFQIAAYKCFKSYFEKSPFSREMLSLLKQRVLTNCIQQWKFAEHSDARRQKTWLKKIKNTDFIDITQSGYKEKIIKKINNWYKSDTKKLQRGR